MDGIHVKFRSAVWIAGLLLSKELQFLFKNSWYILYIICVTNYQFLEIRLLLHCLLYLIFGVKKTMYTLSIVLNIRGKKLCTQSQQTATWETIFQAYFVHIFLKMYAQGKLSNRSKVFTNNSVSPSRPTPSIHYRWWKFHERVTHLWGAVYALGLDSKDWVNIRISEAFFPRNRFLHYSCLQGR